MADYSLNEWWQMRHSPVDNPLPALQLGASIAQHKAQLDLQERELGNQIARTSLVRDEQLFKQNLMLKVDAGNAELARAAAGITDWSDAAQMKPIYDLGARYGHLVGTTGWNGIINTHERAVTAKRLSQNTESLIASRQERGTLNRLIEGRRALVADSTIDVNDARIAKYDRDIALEERRLAVQEGNLGLREREIIGKETRLGLRERYLNERNAVDREEKAKLKAAEFDPVESDRLRKFYNLKRREVTSKFYGPNAPKVERQGLQPAPAPAITPPAPIAPGTNKVSVIAPDGRRGFIPESQLEEALKAGYTKP